MSLLEEREEISYCEICEGYYSCTLDSMDRPILSCGHLEEAEGQYEYAATRELDFHCEGGR